MKHANNAELVKSIIPSFVCPSAESAQNPIFDNRTDAANSHPKPALGLYYPVSMGPTETDSCPFCPVTRPSGGDVYCCQGYSYGTFNSAAKREDTSTGMFGRYYLKRKFSQVDDGLSNTILMGETLPEQCVYGGTFAANFSLAGTTIPLNTFADCSKVGCHNTACGFKSSHPGGAHFAMGDASVRFVSEGIDYVVYNDLGTRAGGEPASLP